MGSVTRIKQSRSAVSRSGNPPRPPNAWILYRSDKLKEIPPPLPGKTSLPQADMSKAISTMWKNEPPEIRAHYEHASEIRKAEHQLQYPNYRFRPLKKEEKARLRTERKQERERIKAERATQRNSSSINGHSATTVSAVDPTHCISSPTYFEQSLNPQNSGLQSVQYVHPRDRVPRYHDSPTREQSRPATADTLCHTFGTSTLSSSVHRPSSVTPSIDNYGGDDFMTAIKSALESYTPTNLLMTPDTWLQSPTHDFIIPLSSSGDDGDWFGFKNDLPAVFTYDTSQDDDIPTCSTVGGPDTFELVDFDIFIEPDEPIQVSVANESKHTFMQHFTPSHTVDAAVPLSRRRICRAGANLPTSHSPQRNYQRQSTRGESPAKNP